MQKVTVNPQLCKSCKYCIKFCPKSLLALGDKMTKSGFFIPTLNDPDKCIMCGICAVSCPEGAITIGGED